MTLRQGLSLVGIGIFILFGLYFFGYVEPNKDKVDFIKEVPLKTKQEK